MRRARRRAALLATLCCAATGCGSSGDSSSTTAQLSASTAETVCRTASRAAGTELGGQATVRITNSDPADLECLLSAGKFRLDLSAQASPRAWDQYDTTVVHQGQAYSGGVHQQKSQLPQDLPGVGTNAAWVPAQSELFATNGTQSTGGSYVTVTVIRRAAKAGPTSLSLARAVAAATLSVAPRGPSPGPPPS